MFSHELLKLALNEDTEFYFTIGRILGKNSSGKKIVWRENWETQESETSEIDYT